MIFALTGPSGAGKTTYAKRLLKEFKDFAVPSHTITTRQPREGKDESKQYTFVTKEEFDNSMQDGEFACRTEFCDNLYGIKKSFIDEVRRSGKVLILDSIQDPQQVRLMDGNVVIVYLSATDEEMEKRISGRPNITKEEINIRKKDYERWEKLKSFCTHAIDTSSSRNEKEVLQELKTLFIKTMLK